MNAVVAEKAATEMPSFTKEIGAPCQQQSGDDPANDRVEAPTENIRHQAAIDGWTAAAEIGTGRVFRAINKAGRVWTA